MPTSEENSASPECIETTFGSQFERPIHRIADAVGLIGHTEIPMKIMLDGGVDKPRTETRFAGLVIPVTPYSFQFK